MSKKLTEEKGAGKHHMLTIGIASILLFLAGILVASLFPKKLTYIPPQPNELRGNSVSDKIWMWQETILDGEISMQPTDQNAFTLTFQPDGKLNLTTDCNGGMGSYELDAHSIAITEIATTKMHCENSQEQVFLQHISEVDAYTIDQGELYLLLPMDSGTMIFTATAAANLQ